MKLAAPWRADAEAEAPAIDPTPRFTQRPSRAPTVESDVAVPFLQSVVAGSTAAVLTTSAWLLFGIEKPAAACVVSGSAVFGSYFMYATGELRKLMWDIEETFGYDLNDDGMIGRPVDNYIPVYTHRDTRAVSIPDPPETDEGDRLMRLRPSERMIPKRRLWDYLLAAFAQNDWTRDNRPANTLNQKEWADVRGFMQLWPDVWGTTSRPTLEKYLRSLGWPGPNGTGRNERND